MLETNLFYYEPFLTKMKKYGLSFM